MPSTPKTKSTNRTNRPRKHRHFQVLRTRRCLIICLGLILGLLIWSSPRGSPCWVFLKWLYETVTTYLWSSTDSLVNVYASMVRAYTWVSLTDSLHARVFAVLIRNLSTQIKRQQNDISKRLGAGESHPSHVRVLPPLRGIISLTKFF